MAKKVVKKKASKKKVTKKKPASKKAANDKPAPKNLGGAPTKYKEEYCQMIIEHMEKGLSASSFAGTIGVSSRSITNWADEHKEFKKALEIAEARALLYWEALGIDAILGNRKNFNTPVFIFTMKNRFKWSDRSDLNIQGEFQHSKIDHELLKSVDRKELIKLAKKTKVND